MFRLYVCNTRILHNNIIVWYYIDNSILSRQKHLVTKISLGFFLFFLRFSWWIAKAGRWGLTKYANDIFLHLDVHLDFSQFFYSVENSVENVVELNNPNSMASRRNEKWGWLGWKFDVGFWGCGFSAFDILIQTLWHENSLQIHVFFFFFSINNEFLYIRNVHVVYSPIVCFFSKAEYTVWFIAELHTRYRLRESSLEACLHLHLFFLRRWWEH